MAINVRAGRQNVVHAKQTISIASTGINSNNVNLIYLMDAAVTSYVPSRSINGFTQFVQGKGYLIDAKVDMDLEEYLAPPFPSGGNGIITEDGNQIIPE